MKIEYLGHSSFCITSDAGAAVVTDPYDSSIGCKMPHRTADAVTLSHHHYDHANAAAVGGNPAVFDVAGQYGAGDIGIVGRQFFHDDKQGALRGKDVVFIFTVDGIKICHLGDIGERFSPEIQNFCGGVDVLMIPVGGTYTIDGRGAAEYVAKLAPRYVIPMHYKTENLTLDIADARQFLAAAGLPVKYAGSEITLSRGDMRGANTQIIVMERG